MEKVLEQMKTNGVSEEGCNNYYGNLEQNCSQMNKCKDCENGEDIHKDSVCTQKKYLVYKLKSYKKLVGEGENPTEKNGNLYKKIIDAL